MAKIEQHHPQQSKSTYVRLDNSNLNKLAIRRMSMLYTDYGKLVIAINELHKQKKEITSKIRKDMVVIKEQMKSLYESLPTDVPKEVIMHAKRIGFTPKMRELELEAGLQSFENLKQEFEKIREQLEQIK